MFWSLMLVLYWQQSTVPVGALRRHADLQAHKHYRVSGVQPRRTFTV